MCFSEIPTTQARWWTEHVLVPVLFTSFGVFLGFVVGRLNVWLDDRRTKRAFLRAVRIELGTIKEHLKGTLSDATQNRERIAKGEERTVHLATAFVTTVYSSQLGKLRDLDDPLVVDVIRFYGDLANLEKIKSHLTSASMTLTTLGPSEREKEEPIATHYKGALDEVINRIGKLLPQLDSLLLRPPQSAR